MPYVLETFALLIGSSGIICLGFMSYTAWCPWWFQWLFPLAVGAMLGAVLVYRLVHVGMQELAQKRENYKKVGLMFSDATEQRCLRLLHERVANDTFGLFKVSLILIPVAIASVYFFGVSVTHGMPARAQGGVGFVIVLYVGLQLWETRRP